MSDVFVAPSVASATTTQSTAESVQGVSGGQVDQNNLRMSLHDRLQRLRLSQAEARRRYEERIRQHKQFGIKPGQTFPRLTPRQFIAATRANSIRFA